MFIFGFLIFFLTSFKFITFVDFKNSITHFNLPTFVRISSENKARDTYRVLLYLL